MGKKPFIDRKQAKHYHVVHRSQRDPLINDPDAPDRVLQEVIPQNVTKYKTKAEIEAVRRKPVALDTEEIDRRIAQATSQGIYFDDVGEYDYSQHLRNIGESTDAVFLAAPVKESKPKRTTGFEFKDKGADPENSKTRRQLIELPSDVLPSEVEMKVGVMNQSTGLDGGLQPDMDPRLREIMEALEDEEFIEEDINDEFFEALNEEGEPYVPDEYSEEEYPEDEEYYEEEGEESYDWEAAFKRFKQGQQRQNNSDDEDDQFDTRSKGTRFSVSSSAMHRTSQLTLLDDRFDKIEEEYMNDDDQDDVFSDMGDNDIERQDFENILDEFLDKYEVVGRKLKQKMDGDTGARQLDHIREALLRTTIHDEATELPKPHESRPMQEKETVELWDLPAKQQQPWDCQTVLSTYSNLENHPQLISDRGPKKKITIDPKTGMPVLMQVERKKKTESRLPTNNKEEEEEEESEEEEEEEEEYERVNKGAPREKHETKEEKKARKAAVKEAKRERREAKKSTKEAFKNEEARQKVTFRQQRQAKGVKHIP